MGLPMLICTSREKKILPEKFAPNLTISFGVEDQSRPLLGGKKLLVGETREDISIACAYGIHKKIQFSTRHLLVPKDSAQYASDTHGDRN